MCWLGPVGNIKSILYTKIKYIVSFTQGCPLIREVLLYCVTSLPPQGNNTETCASYVE